MGPINYGVQVANPFASALQGFQAGHDVRALQLQQQQAEYAFQQQQEQRRTLQGLISNPAAGAKDYANAITMFPQLREPLAKAWEMKSTEQQQSTLRDAGQWFSAVKSGQPKLAVDMMQQRADLIREMGTGLLVTSMIGTTINPNTGDYSRGASGFWVENGEIAYPVNECTVAGNLRDMLRRIVPASDARGYLSRVVPSILIEGMTLAGT